MRFCVNGYTEEDLKDGYDKGIIEGYEMAIADVKSSVAALVREIEDPPHLRRIAEQVIGKSSGFIVNQLEGLRDQLLVTLFERPRRG